jgi:hypothetical protein
LSDCVAYEPPLVVGEVAARRLHPHPAESEKSADSDSYSLL